MRDPHDGDTSNGLVSTAQALAVKPLTDDNSCLVSALTVRQLRQIIREESSSLIAEAREARELAAAHRAYELGQKLTDRPGKVYEITKQGKVYEITPEPYTIDPTFEVLDPPEGLQEQLGLVDTSQQRLAET